MNRLDAEILSGPVVLDALKLRLAAQVAPRRWRRSLEGIADQVDAQFPLEEAARRTALPKELASLLREGLLLPDPTTFLLNALRARAEVQENWRAFLSLISYPLALLVFATFIGCVFSYSVRHMVDLTGIEDFGLSGFETVRMRIDDQHAAIAGAGIGVGWIMLVLATIALVGPAWAWTAVMGGAIIIGRPLRWVSMQELLHRFHLFAEQGVIDNRLGHSVARSFMGGSQAIVAQGVANRVDAGVPIGKSLTMSMLSDSLCSPALLLLDVQSAESPKAFLQTAKLLGSLAEQRCRALSAVMPLVVLLGVGTIIWSTLSCYVMVLMPLVAMISSLS
jgi:hypothetical protein